MEPLKLKPAMQDYIWGGTRLRDEFGKHTSLERVAESWELSCHSAGQSVIMNGIKKGVTLKAYLEEDWEERAGIGAAAYSEFPVLIKLIDACQDLSVQVHPDDRYARENENSDGGKTECWYVMDCEQGAAVACGLNREMTKEECRLAIENGTLMDYVQLVPVQKGDVFFIEPGTLHAIGAGIVIAEIQQNSNLTYRVYDYERVDADGQPRQLHVEKALDVMKTWVAPPRMKKPLVQQEGYSSAVIVDCNYFTTTELHITDEAVFPASEGVSYTHLLCTDGEAVLVYDDGVVMPIDKGESVFLPANFGGYQLRSSNCTILSTRTMPRK
ncbi:MAG: class I mannose-6-phosphate isomerase [Oscillospiraceae bacterium]|nr:class I mannose-6-phosphate isomerase [Oscillospiraceae bacterium]